MNCIKKINLLINAENYANNHFTCQVKNLTNTDVFRDKIDVDMESKQPIMVGPMAIWRKVARTLAQMNDDPLKFVDL